MRRTSPLRGNGEGSRCGREAGRCATVGNMTGQRGGNGQRKVGDSTDPGGNGNGRPTADNSHRNAAASADGAQLSVRAAELVGEVTAPDRAPVRQQRTAAVRRTLRHVTKAAGRGIRIGGGRLTAEVLAMAPRLPVRDRATLRAQFPGRSPDEVADALILGAARASAAVGAAVGVWSVLPLAPAVPVEIATETLTVVGIEIKLVAELHEVYGMRAPGTRTDRMTAYVAAWASRRGIAVAPGGIVVAVGSPLRRRLRRRLAARAGRSTVSLAPLLTGAAAGALLNRRETRRIGSDVRDDLRGRSPSRQWPD